MYKEGSYMDNLFTSGRLTQRLFNSSKARTNRLNTNYFIIFNFPDKSKLASLARQLLPRNYKTIIEVYEDIAQNRTWIFNNWSKTRIL